VTNPTIIDCPAGRFVRTERLAIRPGRAKLDTLSVAGALVTDPPARASTTE